MRRTALHVASFRIVLNSVKYDLAKTPTFDHCDSLVNWVVDNIVLIFNVVPLLSQALWFDGADKTVLFTCPWVTDNLIMQRDHVLLLFP